MHNVSADLTMTHKDLKWECKAIALLKETLAQQSVVQILLQLQNLVLQVQLDALHTANDGTAEMVLTLHVDLKAAQHHMDELEVEVREVEMVCHHLHNMMQELKGNIHVFAHVQPLLLLDVSNADNEKVRRVALASMLFPDSRDHHKIILSSTSESATGQE